VKIERQREILRQFFALRDAHTTTLADSVYRQQAAVYTDPKRAREELAALFRGRPLVAGLSADLPGTGDCFATEVAGVPLLLVRGEDASVRAFLNICRHRGGRVFTGRGRPGRALKCPYHSWAYDLDGDLLGQPLARDAFAALERTELGLIRVPVAERFGLILVSVGGCAEDAIDVEAELAGLGPELASYDFQSWSFYAAREGVFDANWKLVHDTFVEAYHVFSLHRNTLAPDMLSTPFVGESFGPHDRGVVMRKEVVSLLERDESEWELRPYGSIVYILFPNTIINLPMSGHAELWEIYPEPDDPHRSRASVRFFTPAPSSTTIARSGTQTCASPRRWCSRRTSGSSRTSTAPYGPG
jgi:phenylpropionate dioxygenase-like ring-hydroxylating dioxygenase large terminal subunit